jgi:hypothetical protein
MSCSNPFLEITTAYAEAARFTDFGADSDIPAGAEWSKSAIKAMDDDCRAFLALPGVREAVEGRRWEAGVDLWFTRNGHGAGFWDGTDWEEPAATLLTEAAKSMGECELYQGDDGLVYILGREG